MALQTTCRGARRVGRVTPADPDRYNPEILPTQAEVERFLKCTRGSGRPGCVQYYTLWVACSNGGLRIGEALLLRARDLDPERDTLTIPTLKRAGRPRLRREIHPRVTRVLAAWIRRRKLKPEDRLFPISRQAAWGAFRRYAKLAGLPAGVSLHTLRHLRGTLDYEATGDLKFVQHRLRHKSLTSTALYAKIRGAKEKELVRKIGALV